MVFCNICKPVGVGQNWPWFEILAHTTSDWPSAGVDATDHHSDPGSSTTFRLTTNLSRLDFIHLFMKIWWDTKWVSKSEVNMNNSNVLSQWLLSKVYQVIQAFNQMHMIYITWNPNICDWFSFCTRCTRFVPYTLQHQLNSSGLPFAADILVEILTDKTPNEFWIF